MSHEQGNLFLMDAASTGLTSLPGAFPANPPVSPVNEAVQKILDGCGRNFCLWCVQSVPCTCLRRTLAKFLALTLTEYGSANGLHFSFKLSASRSSRSCLVLKVSGLRINESDYGYWPTPNTVDANGGTRHSPGQAQLCHKVKEYPVMARPSPRATDAENGGPNQHGSKGDLMLPSAVMQWQTPVAADATGSRKGKGPGREDESGLQQQVKNWTTPQAHDHQGPGNPQRIGRYGTKAGGCNLVYEVANWSTPLESDWRSICASPETMEKNCRPLREQTGQWAKDTCNTNGKSRGLYLNPRWELQLMGMPPDWLDGVEPEEPQSKRSGTAPSRKSRKSSRAQSKDSSNTNTRKRKRTNK